MVDVSDFKGEKYQLAGFTVIQKGELVKVWAKFCGLDQDPDNLPETVYHPFLEADVPASYPSVCAQDVVDFLVGHENEPAYSQTEARARAERFDITGRGNVLADLGPEKFCQLLILLGEVRKQYLQNSPDLSTEVRLSDFKPE